MLIIHVSQIPPEGLPVHADLVPSEVHLEGEENFELRPGGRLDADVERGDEDSVHVRGHLSARVRVQCGRCLEPFDMPVDQDVDLFYLPHRDGAAGAEEEEEDVELSDRDMVVAFYRGNQLDLGQMVREQLFLALPMKRLCKEACAGLCPTCGIDRNTGRCECPPEPADPRLAPLKALLDRGKS
ncbi:MAG TPA: DUF177 domain-containing protein [Vicinamibacteria bacterium]|jgi:uncharacterized protein